MNNEQIKLVLSAFFGNIKQYHWSTLDQGNINDTLLVGSQHGSFIVQRINGAVFPNPESVAENSALVSAHICRTQKKSGIFDFPEVITTLAGDNYYKDDQGSVWRAQKYIENTTVIKVVERSGQALEIGKCLGRFHRMAQKLSPGDLATTLPDFHNLPNYLSNFYRAWSSFSQQTSAELLFCVDSINENKNISTFFEDALQRGKLGLAVTHGDPKVANVLFDRESDRALTLIDLDTVGPGIILQDIGDCLRSCCCRSGEDDYNAAITCEPSLVAGVVAGYLMENELSIFEKEHLYTALHLITFELGVRFLTDHLQGNRYFKVQNRDDNLRRALVQFRLLRSIEEQQKILRSLIASATH